MKPEIEEIIKDASWYFKEIESLRAQLAEAKADWNGLRDAVYGQNDYPSVNRADAELEANRIREKNRELQAQLLSLQSNNAKLREALNSCSHEIPNLQKKLADGEQEGWEGSKRRMLLKKHIANLLASQPDNELRDRVRAGLEEIQRGEGAFSRDQLQHAANVIENAQRIATELLSSL